MVCLGFVYVVMLTVASAAAVVVASAVSEAWVDSGRLEVDGDSSDELASVLAGVSVDDTTSVGDATSVVDATSEDAAAVEATSAVDTADAEAEAEADGNATPWEVSFLAQEHETGLLAYPRKNRN